MELLLKIDKEELHEMAMAIAGIVVGTSILISAGTQIGFWIIKNGGIIF